MFFSQQKEDAELQDKLKYFSSLQLRNFWFILVHSIITITYNEIYASDDKITVEENINFFKRRIIILDKCFLFQ